MSDNKTADAERGEFEEWARRFCFEMTRADPSYVNEPYANGHTDWCWLAWQAASAGRSELLEALKDCAKFMEMDLPFDVYMRARPEIAKAKALIAKHTKENGNG